MRQGRNTPIHISNLDRIFERLIPAGQSELAPYKRCFVFVAEWNELESSGSGKVAAAQSSE